MCFNESHSHIKGTWALTLVGLVVALTDHIIFCVFRTLVNFYEHALEEVTPLIVVRKGQSIKLTFIVAFGNLFMEQTLIEF